MTQMSLPRSFAELYSTIRRLVALAWRTAAALEGLEARIEVLEAIGGQGPAAGLQVLAPEAFAASASNAAMINEVRGSVIVHDDIYVMGKVYVMLAPPP